MLVTIGNDNIIIFEVSSLVTGNTILLSIRYCIWYVLKKILVSGEMKCMKKAAKYRWEK